MLLHSTRSQAAACVRSSKVEETWERLLNSPLSFFHRSGSRLDAVNVSLGQPVLVRSHVAHPDELCAGFSLINALSFRCADYSNTVASPFEVAR